MTIPSSLAIVRTGKRALAAALLGLLLVATTAPAAAAGLRPVAAPHPHPIVHPTDGVGDSPLVP